MNIKSGKEVKRFMMENGWVVKEVEGSHFQMVHPDRPELGKVTVSVHGCRDLHPDTLARI